MAKVEEWTTRLMRYIDDESLAESLAKKLNESDLQKLMAEFDREIDARIRWWAKDINNLPTQKARVLAIEKMAVDS